MDDPPVSQAEIDAAIQRDHAEARKYRAEADQALAAARKLDIEAAASRILLDREQDKRDRELNGFDKHHVYLFAGAVDDTSSSKCVHELNHWHRLQPDCDIEIVFNSPGGNVFAGMALYDYIQELRRAGHKITTSTRGMAASMGGILLQAGDVRVMGAESFILIHEISTFAGGKIGDIEDTVELLKKMEDRVLEIFASRSKLSKAKLKANWRRKDWWIDSEEALRVGLVDEVR